MFYYYGRKKQISRHYPSPEHNSIVEPFAGSAAYSLRADNWKKEVILIEKDKQVCEVWNWLKDEATPEKINNLPNLKSGEKSSEFLHIIHAATKQAFKYKTIKVTPVLERNWEISKRIMSSSLYKIKHWSIQNSDFSEAPNIKATWFIDPPYKGQPGMGYRHNSDEINYELLAKWILGRKGQLICCEGENGDYLPFKQLLTMPGVAGKKNLEKIYYRSESDQLDLSLKAA